MGSHPERWGVAVTVWLDKIETLFLRTFDYNAEGIPSITNSLGMVSTTAQPVSKCAGSLFVVLKDGRQGTVEFDWTPSGELTTRVLSDCCTGRTNEVWSTVNGERRVTLICLRCERDTTVFGSTAPFDFVGEFCVSEYDRILFAAEFCNVLDRLGESIVPSSALSDDCALQTLPDWKVGWSDLKFGRGKVGPNGVAWSVNGVLNMDFGAQAVYARISSYAADFQDVMNPSLTCTCGGEVEDSTDTRKSMFKRGSWDSCTCGLFLVWRNEVEPAILSVMRRDANVLVPIDWLLQ